MIYDQIVIIFIKKKKKIESHVIYTGDCDVSIRMTGAALS